MALHRILLLGDPNVGKTEFKFSCLEILDEGFHSYNFGEFIVTSSNYNNCTVELWDLQIDRFPNEITLPDGKEYHGVILLYDVTRFESIFNIANWIDLILPDTSDYTIPIVIVGNKIDLRKGSQNEVSIEQVDKVLNRLSELYDRSLSYFEASSIIGHSPEIIFKETLAKICNRYNIGTELKINE